MVKHFKKFLLWNQEADELETWYTASGTWVLTMFYIVPLGWPLPFLWQGQICFWMLLHGWKLIQHWVLMYFQVCSNSAYPQHSGERYRINSPLVLTYSVSICFHRIRHKSKVLNFIQYCTQSRLNKQIYKYTNNESIYKNIKKWKCHHVFSSKNLQQYFPHVSHTISHPHPTPSPTPLLLYPLGQLHIPPSSHQPQPQPNPSNSQPHPS